MNRTTSCVFFLLIFVGCAANLFGVKEYEENEEVTVFVNAMISSKTQIGLDYYTLPVCKPEKVYQLKENLGSILSGDEYSNTGYVFKMNKNVEEPQLLCEKRLSDADAELYRTRIDEDYNVQWLVDDLPAACVVTVTEDGSDLWYEDTHPIGFITEDKRHAIYNHLSFVVSYHETKEGKFRIVRFQVYPSSIDSILNDGKIMAKSKDAHMYVEAATTVFYTYSIKFVKSDIDYGSRWDLYLYGNTKKGVHWFSLTNSLFMTIFLSTIVAIIMLRTLSRDISRYNSITEDERLESVEEGGWKLIHGDVFRPPEGEAVFGPIVGTGIQLLWTSLGVICLAAFGILSPAHRGSILTAAVFVFVLFGFFSGYTSARLNLYFGGKSRQRVTILSAILFPSIVGSLLLIMNGFWGIIGSAQFIHITTILKLLLLWVGISTPLVYLGSYVGYKMPKYHMPVRTNHISRQIPKQPWYLHPAVTCLVGGCVPFGTIFLEMYFMMSSVLLHQTYAVFGFLLVIVLLTVITTAEISIVICYFQLASEDYNWWWRSFFGTGCTALFLLAFSIYYMFSIGITRIVSVILYLCLMVIASIAVFFICGAVGFFSCFWFTRKIYSSLKSCLLLSLPFSFPRYTSMGFAAAHKTLSFLVGAGTAYIGYLSISNELVFRNNRIHNRLIRSVQNRQFVDSMEELPTSKDYAQIVRDTVCCAWNGSILFVHALLSRALKTDQPFDERIESQIDKYKQRRESASEMEDEKEEKE